MKIDFLLITPVKNEEKYIGLVIESVINQTLKPDYWIIINDGSQDQTQTIIEKNIKNHAWIKLLNKTINLTYNWLGYASVVDYGLNYAKNRHISFDKLGLLDGDTTLEKDYFYCAIKTLENDKKIGVTGGILMHRKHNIWQKERTDQKRPCGTARIYNNQVIDKIGGFPICPSPDFISDIKISLIGLKTIVINNRICQHRKTGAKMGVFKNAFNRGISRYINSFTFPHVFFVNMLFMFKNKPCIINNFIVIIGYLYAKCKKFERVHDQVIIEYSKNIFGKSLNRCLKIMKKGLVN